MRNKESIRSPMDPFTISDDILSKQKECPIYTHNNIDPIKYNATLEFDEFYLKKELNELIKAGLSLSQASKYLARKNNLKKSVIYNMY